MSFQFDTLHVSHQLTTGIGYPYCLGLGDKVLRGSVYLDGPGIVGDENTFKTIEGSFMIGPCNNEDSPIPWIEGISFKEPWDLSLCSLNFTGSLYGSGLKNPYSLVVRSGNHFTRDIKNSTDGAGPGSTVVTSSIGAAMFVGDVDIVGDTRIKGSLTVDGEIIGGGGVAASFGGDVIGKSSMYVGVNGCYGGNLNVGSDISAGNDIAAGGEVTSNGGGHVLSNKKNFDIPHPTKEGWRLTHACVEGPEAAAYVRGRVKNKNEIYLPEYWKGLVDIDTITINLTPIGSHQDVIIKRWDNEKVYLQSKGGMPIDCFYHIMAERIDTERLIPEYEGNIEDYPGDNSQRSIAGYHYDNKGS